MNIRLVKLSPAYKEQLTDMLEEWTDYNNHNVTNHSPWVIFKNDYHDFDNYLDHLEFTEDNLPEGFVPSSVFFCLDEDSNQFVGALEIRHYLNEKMLKDVGHIGDGIRPSQRRKGYATAMIALALEECRKLNIHKILMVCNKDNIGSAKSIQQNGGILENEIEENGQTEQRYWITLTD